MRQEAEELGYKDKEVLEYVKQHWIKQIGELGETSGWQSYKQKRKRGQMAKIEADKELTIKEMELKAQNQADTTAAAAPPPLVIEMPSPEVTSIYLDEKDELDSYMLCFKCYAGNARRKPHWLLS